MSVTGGDVPDGLAACSLDPKTRTSSSSACAVGCRCVARSRRRISAVRLAVSSDPWTCRRRSCATKSCTSCSRIMQEHPAACAVKPNGILYAAEAPERCCMQFGAFRSMACNCWIGNQSPSSCACITDPAPELRRQLACTYHALCRQLSSRQQRVVTNSHGHVAPFSAHCMLIASCLPTRTHPSIHPGQTSQRCLSGSYTSDDQKRRSRRASTGQVSSLFLLPLL